MKYILDERFILNEDLNLNTLPLDSGIYCIIFDAVDREGASVQKKYVGQAINIQRRLKDHLRAARPGGRDYLVYNAMRKYPYTVIVLELCPVAKLSEREIYWIRQLHTYVNDMHSKTNKTISKEFNGQVYQLICNGPGYNMTQGGEGTVYYTAEIIKELVNLYKINNFNHTKTIMQFRELHQNDIHLNTLCGDTLRAIIEANDLPWVNEQQKKTIVCANTVVEKIKPEKGRPQGRKYWDIIENVSDKKYKITCDSQVQADALVDFIFKRIHEDLGDVLARIPKNKDRPHASCIKWLIDNGLYDKYLDLSQYNLSSLPIQQKRLGGESKTDTRVTKYRLSLFTVHYNI